MTSLLDQHDPLKLCIFDITIKLTISTSLHFHTVAAYFKIVGLQFIVELTPINTSIANSNLKSNTC